MTSEWISVEERLPEEDPCMCSDEVLVHDAEGLTWIGQCCGGDWFEDNGEDRLMNITHWMPLPPPPEANDD